ncbi:MAG: hypothetical protein AAFY41_01075 [Bacteroidota bacterium]
MNIKRFILLNILFPIFLQSTVAQSFSNDHSYLLGKYSIEVYAPDDSGNWKRAGDGKATFESILDGKFIREKSEATHSGYPLTMDVTMGTDGKTQRTKLLALDKEYSSFDIYEKVAADDGIKFANLDSDPFITEDGQKMYFQLHYKFLDDDSNELIVMFSMNEGISWKPYAKYLYKRNE